MGGPNRELRCDSIATEAVISECLTHLYDALRADRASLKNRLMSTEIHLAALERVGLIKTVANLRALDAPL